MLYRLGRALEWILLAAFLVAVPGGSAPRLKEPPDRARVFTRNIEFDYPTWTARAFWIKFEQAALSAPAYFPRATRKEIVNEYLQGVLRILIAEERLRALYGDPAIQDHDAAAAGIRAELEELYRRRSELAPLAEAILQEQVSAVAAEQGLTLGGQPVPPVLYHVSPLPLALIISPRDRIQQDANISLLPDLTVDQQVELEERVAAGMDVSTLVVPVGGIGSYPTMVMQTTDLRFLASTVAHEWIHNYLTLRPLGMNYATSPELRTMNETAASIAGDELGSLVINRYYPEQAARPGAGAQLIALPAGRADPEGLPVPPFDFRAAMHETRVRADELLAEGRIAEAEAYIEERRLLFWEQGYQIRKLNQAYFAFYGAYADIPGGAAGEDPVGPAVRALRARSGTLANFLKQIGQMSSFEDLQAVVQSTP